MKPSWSDAPEWASYLARSPSGDWVWYEYKPNARFGEWWRDREGRKEIAYVSDKDWKGSLEEKP